MGLTCYDMKRFNFTIEICLGYRCNSVGEYAEGEGIVSLEDNQVEQLVALIKENGGETDVEKLGLKEKFPEIYQALDYASYDAASYANYKHWLIEGHLCGYFEIPEGQRRRTIRNFNKLSEAEKVASIEALYGDVMEQGSPGDFDYTPVIPQGIIDLAMGQ